MGSSSVVDYGIWIVAILSVVGFVMAMQTMITDYSTEYGVNTGGKKLVVGDTYEKVANLTQEINDQMKISSQSSESWITKMVASAWSSMKILGNIPGIVTGFLTGLTVNFPMTIGNFPLMPIILACIVGVFGFTLIWSTFFGTRPG